MHGLAACGQQDYLISKPPLNGGPASQSADAMSLVAMLHTAIEQSLYAFMLAETRRSGAVEGPFSISRLMIGSGVHNHSRVRRAREGLLSKLSIERKNPSLETTSVSGIYTVFGPDEILERRRLAGLSPSDLQLSGEHSEKIASGDLARWLVESGNLSPREVQVALKCFEGLTNVGIGQKLLIHEETVKFHLRNIFIKFGVKRRTELMAVMLQHNTDG